MLDSYLITNIGLGAIIVLSGGMKLAIGFLMLFIGFAILLKIFLRTRKDIHEQYKNDN